ncbi:MAG: O-antigen ligase family protein [Saccharospirillum sp.]|nr:O-antigen ligase family protein [Saccharospirillum sp.]
MFTVIKKDIGSFINGLKGQDVLFYLGCFYIILNYLRPHLIYPQLDFLPWLRITILLGLVIMTMTNRLKITGTHLLVFLFAFLAFISAKNSLYPHISEYKITVPIIFALEVLFLSNCVKNTNQLKLLLIIYFLCIFKMSFFGARTWTMRGFSFTEWGIAGPSGFFENSGEFSLLMAMSAVMSIPFIAALKPKSKIYWLLPITAVMTVMGASSRGSQLALAVGLILLALYYKKLTPKYLIIFSLIASIAWHIFPEQQKERFQSSGTDDTSTARIDYWVAGIDMTKQYPMFGVGYRAFPEHYHNFYKVDDGTFIMRRREVAHNSLVEVASSLGVFALAVYLLLHIAILKKTRQRDEEVQPLLKGMRIALNVGVIVYFIGAFFMSVEFYPYIYFLLSLSIIVSSLKPLKETPDTVKEKINSYRKSKILSSNKTIHRLN